MDAGTPPAELFLPQGARACRACGAMPALQLWDRPGGVETLRSGRVRYRAPGLLWCVGCVAPECGSAPATRRLEAEPIPGDDDMAVLVAEWNRRHGELP